MTTIVANFFIFFNMTMVVIDGVDCIINYNTKYERL